MNIQQASDRSGISRRNIRFYEQKGLLRPARNRDNDYRDYTDADVENLRLIRALRMVDMPLEDIRAVLRGTLSLEQAAAAQEAVLRRKAEDVKTAIRFCQALGRTQGPAQVDAVLTQMDAPPNRGQLFRQWMQDYRRLARAYARQYFTFVPDDPVTNPREFTDALCRYGAEQGLDLVVTKESMYPEFTINGIAYTADRHYSQVRGFPVAVIRCTGLHEEDFAPALSARERRTLRLLRHGGLLTALAVAAAAIVALCGGPAVFANVGGWVIFLSLLILALAGTQRFSFLYWHNTDYHPLDPPDPPKDRGPKAPGPD